jgi:hypothetical protein
MVAAHVEKLYQAQQFRQADLPVPRVVVAGMGRTTLVTTSTGQESIFARCRWSNTMEPTDIEELNYAQKFGEIDNPIAVLVGSV